METRTKDEEIIKLKPKTEKHDHEKTSKCLKIDIEYCKKEDKNLDEKIPKFFIRDFLLGSATTITTSKLSLLNPSVGIIISSSTAILTSIATFFTKEYFSQLKIRYT